MHSHIGKERILQQCCLHRNQNYSVEIIMFLLIYFLLTYADGLMFSNSISSPTSCLWFLDACLSRYAHSPDKGEALDHILCLKLVFLIYLIKRIVKRSIVSPHSGVCCCLQTAINTGVSQTKRRWNKSALALFNYSCKMSL